MKKRIKKALCVLGIGVGFVLILALNEVTDG